MTRPALTRLALTAIALPLALGLAACGKKDDAATGGLSGEPIAKVAPPAGKAWADVIAKTAEGGYRMGNPDAPIKLVEYGSMTCPHCADVSAKSAVPLRDEFIASGRVNFEFRNFVRDAIDVTVSLLARCGSPESFFPLTEQAFANQAAMMENAQKAGEAAYTAAMNQPDNKRNIALAELMGLTDYFAARGIAKDQANACLANVAEAQGLAKRTREQGEQFDIQGTPTFLVNGQSIGSMDWDELRSKLQTMGAR